MARADQWHQTKFEIFIFFHDKKEKNKNEPQMSLRIAYLREKMILNTRVGIAIFTIYLNAKLNGKLNRMRWREKERERAQEKYAVVGIIVRFLCVPEKWQ